MNKTNLKDKTILCIDSGMYVALCRTMKRYFGRVLYFSEYKYPFPSITKFMIGYGFDEMEVVENLFDAIREADVIFSPDIYWGDLMEYLADNGKKVYGSKRGEELEMYRGAMKKQMEKLGLPVNKYVEITGLDNLREYLKKNKNKYIKTDVYRWDFETFHHKNYALTEPMLDNLEYKMGAAKHIYKFLVEDEISGDDVVETGSDFMVVDGKFADTISFGYEIKCEMYAMQFKKSSEVPAIITDFNKAIAPVLAKYKYRCVGCTEIRVGKDKKPYMIDFTSRFGSPPCEIYQEAITNWGDIIWWGSQGTLIEPEIEHKFGVQLFILSDWAIDKWQAVYFPEEIDQWVKLRNSCKVNGTNYVIPTETPLIGNVVAIGDSLEECFKVASERAEMIEGYEVHIEMGAIDKMKEVIAKGEKLGIVFDK